MLYGGNLARTTYGGRIVGAISDVVGKIFKKAIAYLFTKNTQTVLGTKNQSTVLRTKDQKPVL